MTLDKVHVMATIGFLIVLLGAFASAAWLGVIQPARKARQALSQLEGPLGLDPMTTRESAWRATREQFHWMAWPIAKGSRGDFQVEVSVQPPARWLSTLTTVVVSGPHDVRGRVLLTRQPEMLTFSRQALDPFARTPPQTGTDLPSFVGNAKIFHDREQLPRLFNEAVRRELQALPRQWINVGFDGSAMLIAWWGMEEDPAVIERAFNIGMTSLRLLAAQPR